MRIFSLRYTQYILPTCKKGKREKDRAKEKARKETSWLPAERARLQYLINTRLIRVSVQDTLDACSGASQQHAHVCVRAHACAYV